MMIKYDDKKKKDVTVNGIINILQKYKFTIAENTPVEEDIALDPELLGRVFENLLASYNPETKTNARKQTGSFYTPRPIVEYMVDESLKAYLKTKIKDAALSKGSLEEITKSVEEIENNLDSKLDNLIAYNESEPDFSDEERFQILKYIDECKILDPACGSGAFPMGILQKMVYVIHKLDPQNDNWKQIQIQKISNDANLTPKEKNELQSELLTVFDDNELDYARKLYLIENCIHGIDIQPIATQISRLRFFISLIVDQKVDDNKANFGIRPLPNLENRFVTANSLIGLDNQTGYLAENEIIDLKKELSTVRHKLFNAKSPSYKFELKQKDKEIRKKMEQALLDSGFGKENASMISTWDPYDKNRSAEFFDAEWMFGIKDGFDIVIGNPPYVQVKWLSEKEMYGKQGFETFESTGDIYCLFYENGIDLLNQNGLLIYITSNKWLKSNYGAKTRKYIAENSNPEILIDLGAGVFESATVDTNILLTKKSKKQKATKVAILTTDIDNLHFNEMSLSKNDIWNIKSSGLASIKDKIEKIRTRLSDFNVELDYGILTGANKTFILSKEKAEELISLDSKNKEIIKPILRGKDLERYGAHFNDVYLLCTHNGVKSENIPPVNVERDYPTLIPYFESFGEDFKNRGEQGDNFYNLRNCAYIMKYLKSKIIYADIVQDTGKFYLDEEGYFTNDTAFLISGNNLHYLLGILNSKSFTFFYKNFYCGGVLGNKGLRYKRDFLLKVPIPPATPEQQQPIIDLVEKILAAKKADATADTRELEHKIDELVYKLYGLTEEEIAIIEGR